MLSEKMQDALNQQINAELYSAYLYQAMAANFEARNLRGVAGWFTVQAKEEVGHAMRIYDHVNERGGRVTLAAIDAPPAEWAGPLEAFRAAYNHEVKVTGMINDLVALAREVGDTAAENFLQWFVAEQVEEEASTAAVVGQLELAGESGPALLMLDRALGQRKDG